MAMNQIQFQKGMSFEQFLNKYGSEKQCEDAVVASRWPHGFECPHCNGKRYAMTHNGRRLWECLQCGYQCSSIAGTIMESTKLPLRKWFLAMYFMTQSKNAIAALELKRHLGVTYKTAWLLKQKLQEVMVLREKKRVLENRVEIDDAYLGGELTGGKRGRGSENKVPFIAAVQTSKSGHPVYVRFDRLKSFQKLEIEAWAEEALACSTRVVSDGLPGFRGVAVNPEITHQAHVTGHGKKAAQHPQFHWVNTLLGNLKTALNGTYHAFNFGKYAQRYLSEFQYRFNRRFDLASMLPRLLHAAVRTIPHPLHLIRGSEVGS